MTPKHNGLNPQQLTFFMIPWVLNLGRKVPEAFTHESGTSGCSMWPLIIQETSLRIFDCMTQPPKRWAWSWHSVTSTTFHWLKQVTGHPSIKQKGKYIQLLMEGVAGVMVCTSESCLPQPMDETMNE